MSAPAKSALSAEATHGSDARPLSVLADFVALTKPRLSALVLATTAGGVWLAPGLLPLPRLVAMLLGTIGIVGAANALNCYIERDRDRFMMRTRTRPLPAQRLEPGPVLVFGLLLAGVSIPVIARSTNVLTAALALVAFLSYVLLYTPMKVTSPWAMWVGAIPGAIPPLMGWTAVTGSVDAPGVALFAILFVWQLPHFVAIAMFRKDEYQRAGFTSVAIRHGDARARLEILLYLIALVPVTVVPYWLNVAGVAYLVAALALGAAFLALGVWGYVRRLDNAWARQLFLISILYLAALFAVLMLDGGAGV